jgi:hypothetical protein
VLAASIFHNGETTVAKIKQQLAAEGVSVRKPESEARDSAATFNRQCLVPSIDIMNGHAVQLVGGDPTNKKVDAGDPVPLAEQFKLVGEIAVVDLDAALGRGDNVETIKKLLSIAPCRVGGGIRTVEKVLPRSYRSLAVVQTNRPSRRTHFIGSGLAQCWRCQGGDRHRCEARFPASAAEVSECKEKEREREEEEESEAEQCISRFAPTCRERVVVALDARHGEVVVEGWQTKTGKSASTLLCFTRLCCWH